jgi:hypothetical protein
MTMPETAVDHLVGAAKEHFRRGPCSSQHAITHQRPSYEGLDRFGPQGWLLHLNLRLRCYVLPDRDVLLDKGDELFQ